MVLLAGQPGSHIDFIGIHRHVHQAAAELQQRLLNIAVVAVLFLTVIARCLTGPGVFQFQRGECQTVDEHHQVDFFQGIAERVTHLAGAAENIGGEVLFDACGAAGERRRIQQLQVNIVDVQTFFEQMQQAVFFDQPVEALQYSALPVGIVFLQFFQCFGLGVL
jgi:hypothetical protein